ncbi:MAG TPA: hypothetical protein PK605_08525 [Ignavibacteria bacterium]|nr:hypothetical protein [Ignavibacteria bacterium]HAX49949.1 hypothetical protein [Bacteroidota bacterium]HRE12293.1 hypothetical protein [Ignavibacteria bacterium]HRF67134.1 hypothetical protein [Ignavibacteria bacterium]HRJ04432.1 hypothetical protein [Ignavibacteria bacterium]
MTEIHKKYITDENLNKIAVQIPIEEFEKLEDIIENYGLAKLIDETENDETLNKEDALKFYQSLDKNVED